VLNDHSRLDVTERVHLVDELIRGSGGYSDVYYGRFVDNGKYLAVKRLRAHIQKEQQLSKACILSIVSYVGSENFVEHISCIRKTRICLMSLIHA
jgi:hypothetical protein